MREPDSHAQPCNFALMKFVPVQLPFVQDGGHQSKNKPTGQKLRRGSLNPGVTQTQHQVQVPASQMEESDSVPLFSFGVIADIQYADIEDGFNFTRTRRRFYRSSLQLLDRAQKHWSEETPRPRFVLQLGDLIDGFNRKHQASEKALDTVLSRLSPGAADIPVHHVWGNHEFYNFNRTFLLQSRLHTTPADDQDQDLLTVSPGSDTHAYHFSPEPGFRFVVLDAYDESLLGREEGSAGYQRALEVIREHNQNQDLNSPPDSGFLQQRFTMFNGGLGEDQLTWLQAVLTLADHRQERVVIVSHLPVLLGATDPMCLAWNYDKVLELMSSHSSVVCFLAGHDHEGGYCQDPETGVHHVTLEGVIETAPDSDAFGTIYVYEDRMVLKGWGRVPDRILTFLS